jgi:hypothetical protein
MQMNNAIENLIHQNHGSEPKTSNVLLACGLTVAAIVTGTALLLGTVCPLSAITAPSLISGGAVMKLIERNKENKK